MMLAALLGVELLGGAFGTAAPPFFRAQRPRRPAANRPATAPGPFRTSAPDRRQAPGDFPPRIAQPDAPAPTGPTTDDSAPAESTPTAATPTDPTPTDDSSEGPPPGLFGDAVPSPAPLSLPELPRLDGGPYLPIEPSDTEPGSAPLFGRPEPRPVEPDDGLVRIDRRAARPSGDANVQLQVAEAFVNRWLASNDTSSGPVQDCILGAQVTGEQRTTTEVAVDFLPQANRAAGEFILRGLTCNQTRSTTSQAAISSLGRHRFELRKQVEFDGEWLLTRSPAGSATPCQQFLRADTPANGWPILDSLASSIALGVASQMRPQADQETAQRVTRQAAPEFNDRIDEQLAIANRALAAWRREGAARPGLLPGDVECRTSEDQLTVSFRYGASLDSPPAPEFLPGAGASLRIHEAAVSALLDASELGGQEVAVEEIDRWLAEVRRQLRLDAAPAGPASVGGEPPSDIDHAEDAAEGDAPAFDPAAGATLVLQSDQPVHVRFIDQRFEIIVLADVRPAVGPVLAGQRIVIAYDCRMEGADVLLTPAPALVEHADPAGEASLLAGALQPIVQQQVNSRLSPLTIPSRVVLPTPSSGAALQLKSLSLDEGWLALDWQ